MPRTLLLTAALASASALVLTGCGRADDGVVRSLPAAPVAAPLAAVAPLKDCKDGLSPVASFAPGNITSDPATVTDSATLDRIRDKRRLTVGTSGDVKLWGARNPRTGALEGFDIEVLKEVAKALEVPISYKVVNYGQRLTKLESEEVDLVGHTMTINCDRWFGSGNAPNAVNFSAEYYRAGQKVLIRADDRKTRKIQDLANQKVCVPADSTNVTQVQGMGLELVEEPVIGDCLVRFQEGEVAAITGDDTVLAGFAAQDAYAKVQGEVFSAEPYGLGIKADDPQFTRFVNAVLEDLRRSGRLAEIYRETMGTAIAGATPNIPQPVYGRTVAGLDR